MNKLMFFAVLLVLAGSLNAQADGVAAPGAERQKKEISRNAQTPEEQAAKEAARMTEKLGLTDDQKEQWRKAALDRNLANEPHREALSGATTPTQRMDLRRKVLENRHVFDTRVQGFLTDEQKQKLEEERAAKKDKGKERRHRGRH